MNEDYVSYPIAVALKKAGFDWKCDHYYTPNKAMHIVKDNALAPETTNNRFLNEIDDGCCTAVPLWYAQKFLREKHHLSVEPYANIAACFNYNIADLESFADYKGQGIGYPTYESALSAGIEEAIKLIKE